MNSTADQVVAYRLPQDGEEEAYGLCLRREGNTLRVIQLQREDNFTEPLKTVLRKLSDEDGVVSSLEGRFQSLQAKLSAEHRATAQPRNCKLQETMLQWAVRRLEGTDEKEWTTLSQQRRPSAVAKAVACTAASIVAGGAAVSSSWTDAQRMLRGGKNMVQLLREVSERRMDSALYDAVEETYLSDASLSYSSVSQESQPLGALHKWITAVMDYQRARFMEDGEAELQQQIVGCQHSLHSARERRGSLAEQADLINKGNCYIRTQTVRSVPLDHVLYLMTAEKVTTRQYLLKDRAPLHLLEEALARSVLSPRGPRGCRDEAPARAVDGSNAVEHGSTGATAAPLSASSVVSARTARTAGPWIAGHHVRQPPVPAHDMAGGNGRATQPPSSTQTGDATAWRSRKVPVGASPRPSQASSSSPKSATLSTSPPTTGAGSASMEWAGHSGTAPVRGVHGAGSVAPDPQHVLADVKNNFKNVQETLLACLGEYEQLEENYLNTVEHSRQLLETLEDRESEIARLREDLAEATQAQLLANRVITLLQLRQANGKADGAAGTVGTALQANGHSMNGNHDVLLAQVPSFITAGSGAFHHQVELIVEDTLDFLRGTAAAPPA